VPPEREVQENPKLSPQTQEQIEQLALVAVTNIVHVVTTAMAQIMAKSEAKISEQIAPADIKGE
jgi:hypothetical protein